MNQSIQPKALLLVSSHCPHCHNLEKLLQQRMQREVLSELQVINIEESPELAQQLGVRSVPWLRLGELEFSSALSPSQLDQWIKDIAEDSGHTTYLAYLLENGNLSQAIDWIEAGKIDLAKAVDILRDSDVKLNIRIGIGAILEHFEDSEAIKTIVPQLVALLDSKDPTTRTDACHYLSLTHSKEVITSLQKMLDDESAQVREVAQDSIELLTEM